MDSELPIYYSKSGLQMDRHRVIARDSEGLGTRIKPSQVPQIETLKANKGVCFVDLPYPAKDDQGSKRHEKIVFVKGHPTSIFFSDRLDSGLCRMARHQKLVNTTSDYSEKKLGFKDEDFRVWIELKMVPGRDRLSKTRVMLAHHRFFWRTNLFPEELESDPHLLGVLSFLEHYENIDFVRYYINSIYRQVIFG